MNEFLRSTSYHLVTTILILVWSGMLLGISWKLLTLAWNILRRYAPRKTSPSIRVLRPSHPRIGVSQAVPALPTGRPAYQLTETHYPLLTAPNYEPVEALSLFDPYHPTTNPQGACHEPVQSYDHPLCDCQ
jgi:hypothetical protein